MFGVLAEDNRFRVLIFVVLVLAALGLAAYSYLAFTQAKFMHRQGTTITVAGKSERFVKPDIATFTFSVLAEDKDATVAQSKSAESMNEILAYLKESGVEEKDIKTEYYDLSPKYEYTDTICTREWGCPPSNQVLAGYTVNQTVSVKVRKIEQAGSLLSGVGSKGATDVSGLSFTVDDPEAVKEEVRAEAIRDARENAKRLAQDLGVRLGRLINFYENGPAMPYNAYGGAMMEKAVSMDMAAPSPELPPGEQEIVVTVNLMYEIK